MWTDSAALAFVVIPLVLVALLLWGVSVASRRLEETNAARRRALAVTVAVAATWMTATWATAGSGVLRQWDATPPPFALLLAGIVGLAVAIASTGHGSRLARGLPLWTLVASQGFRLPAVMVLAALAGHLLIFRAVSVRDRASRPS